MIFLFILCWIIFAVLSLMLFIFGICLLGAGIEGIKKEPNLYTTLFTWAIALATWVALFRFLF